MTKIEAKMNAWLEKALGWIPFAKIFVSLLCFLFMVVPAVLFLWLMFLLTADDLNTKDIFDTAMWTCTVCELMIIAWLAGYAFRKEFNS